MSSYDVFLSHSSADKPAVEELGRRLREAGLDPFLDKWHLIPGKPYQAELVQALDASSCCAVFFGSSGEGVWHSEEMQAALNKAVRTRNDYRVIPVLLPGADPTQVQGFLEQRTWVDFRAGLDDDVALGRLTAAVRGEPPDEHTYELPDEPRPYRGLGRFELDQYEFFFGRDDEIRRLVDRLEDDHFVAVVGASGSGKSSLVRAGLCTRVAKTQCPGIDAWRRIVIVPGDDPLRGVATQLVSHLDTAQRPALVRQFMDDFRRDSSGLITALATLFPDPGSPVLMLIDQFEEVFTHRPVGESEQRQWRETTACFAANLLAAHRARPDWLRMLVTLRADFLDRFVSEGYPDFRALLEKRQFWLGEMGEDDLREAIVFPATRRGAFFEKGLVEMILGDMRGQTAALPLLEEALDAVWAARRGPWLTVEGYQGSGGVGGALARKAEKTWSKLDPGDQVIARRILVELVQLGEGTRDTRRRVPVTSLVPAAADPAHVQGLIDRFASKDVRLISLSSEETTRTAEITHEALISHWDRLRAWLDTGRDNLRLHRRLDEAARHWEQQGHAAGSLWRPPDLELMRRFVEENPDLLTTLQLEFYRASELAEKNRLADKTRQDRRLRARLRASLVAAAVAFAAAGFATYFGKQAADQSEIAAQQAAKADSLRRTADLATVGAIRLDSSQTTQDAEIAALLVLEALNQEPKSLQAQLAFARVLEYFPPVEVTHAIPPILTTSHGVRVCEFSEDGGLFAFADEDRRLQVLDTRNGNVVHASADGAEGVTALAFEPRGELLIVGDEAGEVQVLRVDDWKPITTVGLGEPVQAIAFIRHGREFAVAGLYEKIQTWAVGSWKPGTALRDRAGDTMSIQFSPDGQWMATTTWHSQIQENVIRFRDLASGRPMGNYLQGDPSGFALSGDGRYVAVSGSFWKNGRKYRNAVWLFELRVDPETGEILHPDVEHYPVTVKSAALAFDALARRIAIAADDTFRVLATRVGRDVAKIEQDGVEKLAFVRDGSALAAAGNGRLTIWDFSVGRDLARRLAETNAPLDFAVAIQHQVEGVAQRIGRTLTPEERDRFNPEF